VTAIFPVLPGLAWSVTKAPRFATRIQRAVSGRECASSTAYPTWTWTLSYSLLRDKWDARGQGGLGRPATMNCARSPVFFLQTTQGAFSTVSVRPIRRPHRHRADDRHRQFQRSVFQLVRSMGGCAEPVTGARHSQRRSTATASCKAGRLHGGCKHRSRNVCNSAAGRHNPSRDFSLSLSRPVCRRHRRVRELHCTSSGS